MSYLTQWVEPPNFAVMSNVPLLQHKQGCKRNHNMWLIPISCKNSDSDSEQMLWKFCIHEKYWHSMSRFLCNLAILQIWETRFGIVPRQNTFWSRSGTMAYCVKILINEYLLLDYWRYLVVIIDHWWRIVFAINALKKWGIMLQMGIQLWKRKKP